MKLFDTSSLDCKTLFPQRLKKLMENKTQVEVARATKITRQNLSKYLKGTALPNAYTLAILAEYFNVTSDYLLGIRENSVPDSNIMRYKLYPAFSNKCIRGLEDISADGNSVRDMFDRIVSNKKFKDLLLYIDTYLMFSAKAVKGSTPEAIEKYKEAKRMNVFNNENIRADAIPYDEITIADYYYIALHKKLQEIIDDVSKKYSSEYTKRLLKFI